MKRKILFLLSAVLLLAGCSSDDEDVIDAYSYGIYEYNGDFTDLVVIETYMQNKDVYKGNKVFTGSSQADCNKQALTFFEQNEAKLNRSELKQLLNSATTFTYGCVKSLSSDSDPDAPTEYVGVSHFN